MNYTKVGPFKIESHLYEFYKKEILTVEALNFVKNFHLKWHSDIESLLEYRNFRQELINNRIDRGEAPLAFPYECSSLKGEEREFSRKVHRFFDEGTQEKVKVPQFAQRDNDVVLISPVNLVAKGLSKKNAGLNHIRADFEDAELGAFEATLMGLQVLKGYARGNISFKDHVGRQHHWNGFKEGESCSIAVRVNGFGLGKSREILFADEGIHHIVLELALNHFWNAQKLNNQSLGPIYYIPKLRFARGARLAKDMLDDLDVSLQMESGTSKVILMNEELSFSFEQREAMMEMCLSQTSRQKFMEVNAEISFNEASLVAINSGYWDYNASVIEQLSHDSERRFPTVSKINDSKLHVVAMQKAMISNAQNLGVHPEGGMFVGLYQNTKIKGQEEFNKGIDQKIFQAKKSESLLGMDSTWIALPQAYESAKSGISFNLRKSNSSNVYFNPETLKEELLKTPKRAQQDSIQFNELCETIRVPLEYAESWVARGIGCSPIAQNQLNPKSDYSDVIIPRLMEDVATSRRNINLLQYWSIHSCQVQMPNGTIKELDTELFVQAMNIVLSNIYDCLENEIFSKKSFPYSAHYFEDGLYEECASMMIDLFASQSVVSFFTEPMRELYFKHFELRSNLFYKTSSSRRGMAFKSSSRAA